MFDRKITQLTVIVICGVAPLAHESRHQFVGFLDGAFRSVHETLLDAAPIDGVPVTPFRWQLLDLKLVVAFLAGA
ncbi:hypothetical protein J3A78_000107 [Streptomyces sp. PvR006]|uniref:hypothetical protein n=1 Tax=Streptomyces sp. PvR006 TaxID=2817860 RepID=UPI001AE42879|nr:hypothetical protein [Streptomyces sp. PvR006]